MTQRLGMVLPSSFTSLSVQRAREVFDHVVAILFTLPEDAVPEDIELESHFLFYEKPFIPLRGTEIRRCALTASFMRPRVSVSQPNVVIGGVTGWPQSGKTSFIRAIRENAMESIALTSETPYLFKHCFSNFKFPNGERRTFSYIDTPGHYFDIDSEDDKRLLGLFIKGLAERTDFRKRMNLNSLRMDPTNAVTHMILTVPARKAFNGVSWLGNFIWTSTPGAHLPKLVKLYNEMVRMLAENQHGDTYKARSRIGVLITHMDTIEPWQREEARRTIMSGFRKADIPENLIVFGSKECIWKEKDLKEHERKVNEFLQKVDKDRNYYDILREEKLSYSWFHIDDIYCQKGNCKHKFDDDIQSNYLNLLMTFLNTL
jgi:hypothetical protein